jgi:DNA-binding response OmpR family regulator
VQTRGEFLPQIMNAGQIPIVDDDVRLAGMLVELLAGENFQPAQASNGAAALACLARRSFDLVILDVMMPKLDGLELLRRVRKEAYPF